MSPVMCQCPACGFLGEEEAFASGADWKRAIREKESLPEPVRGRAWEYIALFRPKDRGLTAKRALRILESLRKIVTQGTVRYGHGVERPAPPELWAEAMLVAIERDPPLEHLTDHGYIVKVAYDRAGKACAKSEREKEDALRRGERVTEHGRPAPVNAPPEYEQPPEEERRAVMEMLSAFAKNFGR